MQRNSAWKEIGFTGLLLFAFIIVAWNIAMFLVKFDDQESNQKPEDQQ